MKYLLSVIAFCLVLITPTLFAQYVSEGISDGNEDARTAVFLGFASIVGIGVFIKLNYEHYVHKTGEGEGSWWILLAALLCGYLSYTL